MATENGLSPRGAERRVNALADGQTPVDLPFYFQYAHWNALRVIIAFGEALWPDNITFTWGVYDAN